MKTTVMTPDAGQTAGTAGPGLQTRRQRDVDGALRLVLIGELDIAVTAALQAQLDQLRRAHDRVRLDLSQLTFIDCHGIGEIIRAVREARRDDWPLEVDAAVSASVRRMTTHGDIASALWPTAGADEPDGATRGVVVSAM